jgi:AcrR family transcriptional regulator
MLIAQALTLADEGGLAAVSLREAARRVGVTHAAAYHHFPDKTGIIAAAATEGMCRLADALERTENEPARSSADRVARLAAAYVEFAQIERSAFRLMFSPDVADKSRFPALRSASDRAAAPLVRSLSRWADGDGVVIEEQIRELAVTIWSLAHGIAVLALHGQFDEGELCFPEARQPAACGALAYHAVAKHLDARDRLDDLKSFRVPCREAT